MADDRDPRTVLLKRIRLRHPDIKEMGEYQGKLSFRQKLVIEFVGEDEKAKKYAQENKEKSVSAMKAACVEKWKKEDVWKGIQEDNPKRVSFRKGERFKSQETGVIYAGFEGNYGISTSGPSGGKFRPKLKDRYKRDVVEADIEAVFYDGVYCDAFVSFYGSDEGGRGVFASVELLRSWQEGEKFGHNFSYDEDELDDPDDLDDDDLGAARSDSKPSTDAADDF